MMGRYNSLFGIDMDALKDIKVLEAYIKNGRGQTGNRRAKND